MRMCSASWQKRTLHLAFSCVKVKIRVATNGALRFSCAALFGLRTFLFIALSIEMFFKRKAGDKKMPKNVIVLDAETTGLDTKKDEILQLTILSANGETLFDNYFCPTKNTSWADAEKIHHITYDTVKDHEPISTYIKTISKIINSADVIVGYNHSFDMAFLEEAGIRSDPKKNYDLMLEFSQLRGEWDAEHNHYKWFKLKECADYFGYNWGSQTTHNTLSDCKAILYCYNKILAGETKEGGLKSKAQHPSAFRSTSHNVSKGAKLLRVILPFVIIFLAGFALLSLRNPSAEPERKISTITASTLREVLDISDLSTVEFRYGSVVQALDNKNNVKYYVSYLGTVRIGVDFQEIAKSLKVDTTEKTITLTIPQPRIFSTNVNVDTLDYIFIREKYNKTGITGEALKLCRQDLIGEVKKNQQIHDIAVENAKNAIEQLLAPWLTQPEGEYTIIYK